MSDLSDQQIHFVRLHQGGSDWVAEWRHLFQGAMIRATTTRKKTATLARDAVQELVDAGLMKPNHGGSFYLTEAGKLI